MLNQMFLHCLQIMIYKDLILKDGSKLAKLGLGSWNLAMNLSKREDEIEAID